MPRLAGHARTTWYDVVGDGPDVVFLHGLSADAFLWAPVVDLLEGRARCVLPELWGHGRSFVDDARWTFQDQVDEVRAVLRVVGVKRPLLVGAGFGATIAAALAVSGDDVSGLLLCAPKLRRPLPGPFGSQGLAAVREKHRSGGPDALAAWAAAASPEAFTKANKDRNKRVQAALKAAVGLGPAIDAAMGAPSLVAEVGRLPVPLTVVLGAEDPTGTNDVLDGGLRADVLRVLPRVGHRVPLEAPAIVVEELLALLDRAPAAA